MITYDAIVIGAGPNGLVAANVLADAGWSVLVLESQPTAGGAVQTAEVTAPGFRNDMFSAFYPMTAASPVIDRLELGRHGLQWTHAPKVMAHPRGDGAAAILDRDIDVTAASLDAGEQGDGDSYRRLMESWMKVSEPLMASLLNPFPPIVSAGRLVRAAGPAGLRELARLALVPVRRFAEEHFAGEPARLLFAGNALHADLTPETAGSAVFGWLLVGLGQQYGFPVPVGGAAGITDALVARSVTRNVTLRCDAHVVRVVVDGGRVSGVVTSGGDHYRSRTVLADCDATKLFVDLVGQANLPAKFRERIGRIQRSSATFKVDWALSAPVPWTDPDVVGAGTVHVAETVDELTMTSAQLALGLVPDKPFLLIGQMTTADPTRSPPGTESMWAYTHVPQQIRGDAGDQGIEGGQNSKGEWSSSDAARFTERIEQRIEALAPGFTSRILARHVMTPADLEQRNANLVGGDISGGTAQLHQQVIFRPVAGFARPETPIKGLFLASASAHPGGAVHGAPGANAARAALLHDFGRRRLRAIAQTPVRRRSPSPADGPTTARFNRDP